MNLDRIIAVRNSKTIYRDGNTRIKVFDNDYSKADILNEALNQARVEETDLNIPKILEVATVNGKWAIVYDYIAGKTLSQLIDENPDKFDEYMEMFVDLQLEVLGTTCPLLNKLKDKMSRQIASAELDATVRFDLRTRLEEMPKRDKLCHGDFTPSNIVITENGTPYILDWAHAAQGNGTADAARTYLLFCLKNDQASADRYLEVFCERSGADEASIRQWFPFVAAAQSTKCNPTEREYLLTWLNADIK